MMKMAKRRDNWFVEVLTVDDTNVVSKKDIEEEREEGMPEVLVQQEYYCSFDAPLEGALPSSGTLRITGDVTWT